MHLQAFTFHLLLLIFSTYLDSYSGRAIYRAEGTGRPVDLTDTQRRWPQVLAVFSARG